MADLDAIEAALAGWRGVFAARPAEEYDNGGPMVANVVRLGPRLAYLPDDGDEDDAEAWTDIGDMDPHCHPSLAVLLNAPGPLAAEIRTLRTDLAAARLDAANARSAAAEAIGLAETWAISLSGDDRLGRHLQTVSLARIDEIKARLASPADFAARVTAALDRLVEVAASEFPGSAKVDAARSEVDAAIGVAE